MDYNNIEKAEVIPNASSMIESFRAVGYSFETAIADIIDNSISAEAKNIWVNFEWKGSETWFSIKDDGIGMNNDELIQAMKPGSKNANTVRQQNDLGRYGLGLKSSSFSQCRKFTVISKRKNSSVSYWTWDLDYVNDTCKWEVLKILPKMNFQDEINNLNSGTIVIWNKLDRLVKNFDENDEKTLDKFLIIMERTKKHLSMVFHKFMESDKINIYFEDRVIKPWNPFLIKENATQEFPQEILDNEAVSIQGYVLPHKSKIDEETYKYGEGPKGWNGQQGFYIYRNNRLLVAGGWLNFFRMEEHYKLARIKIELPNNLDEEWQIDIKKSIARPPLILREQIRAYAANVRMQAVEVYRHRGKILSNIQGQNFIPLWVYQKKGDKWFYKLNREHPLIENIQTLAENKSQKAISALLNFIESTIPVKSIYIKEAENSEEQGVPTDNIDLNAIKQVMHKMYDNLINEGRSEETAKTKILNIEPFNHYPDILETLN